MPVGEWFVKENVIWIINCIIAYFKVREELEE